MSDKRDYYWNVYLKSDHWKQLRAKKLQENPCCQKCGSTKKLDVHHKCYRNLYDVQITDLRTLCRKCHDSEHDKIDNKRARQHRNATTKSNRATISRLHRMAYRHGAKFPLPQSFYQFAWNLRSEPTPYQKVAMELLFVDDPKRQMQIIHRIAYDDQRFTEVLVAIHKLKYLSGSMPNTRTLKVRLDVVRGNSRSAGVRASGNGAEPR